MAVVRSKVDTLMRKRHFESKKKKQTNNQTNNQTNSGAKFNNLPCAASHPPPHKGSREKPPPSQFPRHIFSIRSPRLPSLGNPTRSCLEIAVNDLAIVAVLEGKADLREPVKDLVFRKVVARLHAKGGLAEG